jgi:hypothetical protein
MTGPGERNPRHGAQQGAAADLAQLGRFACPVSRWSARTGVVMRPASRRGMGAAPGS